MNVMLLRLSLLASVVLAAPTVAQDADESALDQFDTQPPVIQTKVEAPGAAELRDAVRRMAQRPTDPLALTDAGYASLKLGDGPAALNFFTRANALQPGNSRIIAGLGSANVHTENPFEALRYFDDALKMGVSERTIALDRALAFDLLGNFERAQQDYRLARGFWDSDELTRRQAMSLSMAGKANEADAMLVPLLQKNDPEAWRARAFMLAARGDYKQAVQITEGFLDAASVRRMEPFLRQMPRLTDAQKAAALHFGHFPAGRIGEDSPEVKKLAANTAPPKAVVATGQDRLIPAGEPLGTKGKKPDEQKKPQKADRRLATADPAPGFSTEIAQKRVDEAAKAKTVIVGSGALPPPDSARPAVRLALPPLPQPKPAIAQETRVAVATVPPPTSKSAVEQVRERQETAAATLPAAQQTTEFGRPPAPAPARTDIIPALASAAIEPKPDSGATQGPLPDGAIVPIEAVRIAAIEPSKEVVTSPVTVEPAPPPAPKPFDLGAVVTSIKIPESEQKRQVAPVDLKAIKAAAPKVETVAAKDSKAKPPIKGPAHPARHWVQIATGAESALGFDYRRLAKKSPELFKGKEGWTAAWGKTSRLLVGPFDDVKTAKKWESDFRKGGGDGFVWQSENGSVVTKLGGK